MNLRGIFMFGSKKRKALKASDITTQLLLPIFHIVKLQNNNQIPYELKDDNFVLGYMSGAFFKIWAGSGITDVSLFNIALEKYFSNFFPSKGNELANFCNSKASDKTFKKHVALGANDIERILMGDVDGNSLTEHFLSNY
jgi:hypothetical protein